MATEGETAHLNALRLELFLLCASCHPMHNCSIQTGFRQGSIIPLNMFGSQNTRSGPMRLRIHTKWHSHHVRICIMWHSHHVEFERLPVGLAHPHQDRLLA